MAKESCVLTSTIFGTDFFSGSLDEAASAVIARARSGHGGYACLGNVHVLMTAQRDTAVRKALQDAWVAFPDGAPLAWLQRRMGARISERIAGPDLMTRVLELGRESGLRHYLFGSTPIVVSKLHERLNEDIPGANIVGAESPPFDAVEFLEPSAQLRSAQPDVIWCSLGAPKQELWMQHFATELRPAVVLGVGAAFDFVAGLTARAPRWMQHSGLEWCYRLAKEPRRLGSRYLSTNPEFVVRALWLLARGVRS